MIPKTSTIEEQERRRFKTLFAIYPGNRCTVNDTDVSCIVTTDDFYSDPTYEPLVSIATLQERLLHPENGIQWGKFTPQPGESPIFLDTISNIQFIFFADPSGKIILHVYEQGPNPHIDIHTKEINPRPNISASSTIQVWPAIPTPPFALQHTSDYPALHTNQIVFTGEYIETPDFSAQYR